MDYFSGWCKSKARLEDKTVIVTGSNSGIGKETVLDLYKRGAKVIMACRDPETGVNVKKELENKCSVDDEQCGMLLVKQLDLCSLQSIRKFAEHILETEPNINILVNNAGVMMCPQGKTEEGFEKHIGTNHLGHVLLTLLLLPRIRSSAPARVICVSSRVHQSFAVDLEDINFEKKSYNAFEAYCRSKSANILFARELARKLNEHKIEGVNTYSLHPGIVHTALGRHFSETYMSGATWIWNNILSWFLKSAKCGAQTSIFCAVHESCTKQTGLYYSDCAVTTSSKETQSEENGRRLWDISMKLLKLEDYNPFTVRDMGVAKENVA